MKNRSNIVVMLVCATALLVGATVADAQVARLRVSNQTLRALLTRIETNTDAFQRQINTSLDRSRINNTNREDAIVQYISDFEAATDALSRTVNSRGVINSEVNEVLTRGTYIDQLMARNRFGAAAERSWRSIRADLGTLANYYTLTWNWNQTLPSYPNFPGQGYPPMNNDPRIRTLITGLETKTDSFKNQMTRIFNRQRWDNTNRDEDVFQFITGFENATDVLRTRYDARQPIGNEVSDVLTQAAYIDRFMTRNRVAAAASNQWVSIRTDLNSLASLYNVSWNWNQNLPSYPLPGGIGVGSLDSRLTGTFRLNDSLSDNVSNVLDRSLNVYSSTDQRTNARRNLERRLNSPDMLAIEVQGRTVSLASSLSPQVTFQADGVTRSETNARGRTMRTTASLDNNGVSLNYQGDRGNDFVVNFEADRNDRLRVTRRIYLDNRNETITVNSVYDRVDRVARWSDMNNGLPSNTTGGTYTDFYIPNGTRITAILRNNIDTRASQTNDRFTMDVTSPAQFSGAVIEGHVASVDTSGRLSGRANVSLDFDTIRLRNGQTYRFAGLVDNVRAANGETLSINNEGAIRDNNQTTKTVTRAGIGAAIGAIIGAIAGGGQGAAIGATVGAGAGAGSVLIQGRDNMVIGDGSEFTITASSPNNVGYNRP